MKYIQSNSFLSSLISVSIEIQFVRNTANSKIQYKSENANSDNAKFRLMRKYPWRKTFRIIRLLMYSCTDTNNFIVNSSSTGGGGTFDDWFATASLLSSLTYINSNACGMNGVMNVEATADATVSLCIFITGPTPHCSGLLSLTKISGIATVNNCIFASGSAETWSGGFGTYENYTGTPRPYFDFSFFCNHFCSNNNRGADFAYG